MELSPEILDFYDKLLDGQGMAKMVRKGLHKGLDRNHIRIAARIIYEKHHSQVDDFIANPLSVAKQVYKLARNLSVKQIHHQEMLVAKKPFRQRLYEWFPSEIYFSY